MFKTTITYSTPCFESFIKEFGLSPDDYDVIRSSIHNVRVKSGVLAQLANAFVKGYSSALTNTRRI